MRPGRMNHRSEATVRRRVIAALILPLLAGCCERTADVALDGPGLRPSEVLVFTSEDGQSWVRAQDPVAANLDTLGLSVRDEGEVWVTGLDHGRRHPPWERLFGGAVHGLRYSGGTWTRAQWRVKDPEAPEYIDPQWVGDELWYVARDGGAGDPAQSEAPNRVRSAPSLVTHFEAVGVADPSPVEFGDQRFVFVTIWGRGVVQLAGDPLQELRSWPEVTVPFATVIDDEIWLLAQKPVDGWHAPVLSRSADGHHWTPWSDVPLGDLENNCTSPVLGRSGDLWLLLCALEVS